MELEQESEAQEVIISYDTLFEILRNEKTKEDLQKLGDSFFNDVVNYLNDKQTELDENSNQKELFENDEREKKIQQVANVKKIIKDIYERREKKIMNMALNKSRFSASMIDTSSLLDQEKMFYETLIKLFEGQRENILAKLINGVVPGAVSLHFKEGDASTEASVVNESESSEAEKKIDENNSESNEVKEESSPVVEETNVDKPAKLIRFLTAVPQFMGIDMLEYGPYDEEDVSKLPGEIANLLIEKERAEEIKEN
jgi:DNA replication initiation complex subunit (GINS family)|tara:strand:+ start:564 stop:1331 length:768 start_codon:yes stop_codon:yes gene_type:complete